MAGWIEIQIRILRRHCFICLLNFFYTSIEFVNSRDLILGILPIVNSYHSLLASIWLQLFQQTILTLFRRKNAPDIHIDIVVKIWTARSHRVRTKCLTQLLVHLTYHSARVTPARPQQGEIPRLNIWSAYEKYAIYVLVISRK